MIEQTNNLHPTFKKYKNPLVVPSSLVQSQNNSKVQTQRSTMMSYSSMSKDEYTPPTPPLPTSNMIQATL